MRRLAFLALAFLAACATPHISEHTGFHLHGAAGPATIVGEGIGGSVSASAGVSVAPNLIVGAEAWGIGAGSGISDAEIYGFGPMLKYYFMPVNVYLAATPSFTRASSQTIFGDPVGEDEWGFGLRAAIGKEWFVSERWGLGFGGVFDVVTNRLGDDETVMGGALVFSASFN
jgi:hypothetical protein